MSVDSDDATKLLSAATQCADRGMTLVFAAEARLLIGRERQRLREQSELLDALEREILEAGGTVQQPLGQRVGSKS